MSQTIPAMPTRDVAAGVDFYRDRRGNLVTFVQRSAA